jgi:hypothetical protein
LTGDSEIIALRATVIGGTLSGAALIRPRTIPKTIALRVTVIGGKPTKSC